MADKRPLVLKVLSVAARVATVVVVLAIGAGVFALLQGARVDPEPVPAQEAVLPVRSIQAVAMPMPRVFAGYGTARAMDAAEVSAQIAARVVERPAGIEPGVRVEAGDLLLRLDATDFAARVEAGRQQISSIDAQLAALAVEERRLQVQHELAQEEVEIARRDLQRIRQAAESGSGTDADIDVRLGALRRAERAVETILQSLELVPARRDQLQAERSRQLASLRLDEENLVRTEVRSPIAGVLQRVDAEVGEYLRTGDSIARVVDLTRVEVPLRLPLSARPVIAGRTGLPVTLTTDRRSNRQWEGTLVRCAPEADIATRTITVFVEVAQPEGTPANALLTPGQFVMGRVAPDDGHDRIVLPRRAVVGDRVMVVRTHDEGPARAEAVPVRVSHYVEGELPTIDPDELQWAVLEPGPLGGLQPGEAVIVSNLDSLGGGEAIDPSPVIPLSERADAGAGS